MGGGDVDYEKSIALKYSAQNPPNPVTQVD